MSRRKDIQAQFEDALLEVLSPPSDGSSRKLNSRILDVARQYLKDSKEDEVEDETNVVRGEIKGLLAEYDKAKNAA